MGAIAAVTHSAMLFDTHHDRRRIRIVSLSTASCRDDYRRRLAIAARGLARLAPDIVLLQEAFATPDHVHSTPAHLARALDMHCAFLPANRAPRPLDNESIDSYCGLAILARHPIVAAEHIDLPSEPDGVPCTAQCADIDFSGIRILTVNVELSSRAGSDALRGAQCRELHARLAGAHDFDYALIGGDFNAGPDDSVLAPLRDPSGFSPHEAAPERGVDRIFVYTRASATATLDLARCWSVLEAADPATGLYAAERPGLAADFGIKQAARPQPWVFAVSTAAE